MKIRYIDEIARGLVSAGQIDVRRIEQCERIYSGAAINRRLGPVIGHEIVARSRADDVGTAAPVDRVVAGAGHDGIDAYRAGHIQRRRQGARIETLEASDVD